MLRALQIRKTYNKGEKIALDNFSIDVPKGSVYGLLGPNGAGKTSFIRIINQITKADSGSVYINQKELNPDHIKDIGYMPEERGLYKNMTIGEQLIYFGRLKGMNKKDVMLEAKYWFEKLLIEDWWNKKLNELSKGMAQKVQFIVTVIHRPRLLILDEPFSGFDPVNANLIKDQIIELKKNGTTIILSTHRMESVEEMCDYVALVNKSRKILDGKVFDVCEKFKKNVFNVVIQEPKPEIIEKLKEIYQFENLNYESGLARFRVKNITDQNALLKELMLSGKIRSFDEKIPSMNEVFISAVS